MIGESARPLSERAHTVWAKTRKDPGSDFALSGWLPLHQHLDDTGAIAARLWDDWAPRSVKESIARAVGSADAARSLLCWLAGTHDVGKASPAFAVQAPALADDMRLSGLDYDPRIADGDERRKVRHELVSYLAIRDWLRDTHGFEKRRASQIASVAAAHHGRPATDAEAQDAEPRTHLVGAGPWAQTRREFLAAADQTYADPAAVELWRRADIPQPVLVLLSGLVIVSDWIASSDLFPPAELGSQPEETTAQRVTRAWKELDFPRPWHPKPRTMDAAQLLIDRFSLPKGSAPHPTQTALVEEAWSVSRPELMILEAEMGSGKTEAALLAAEIIASRFGMSGIFVGLPTQATADGMFARVLSWADRLGLSTPASVFLARSRANLNTDYARKTRQAYFRSIADDAPTRRGSGDESTIAHRWFTEPRRGPLSDFVVGTVDQALFAGLRSRYLMLRHLALASKVVVIDEAHAYDAYMQEYLAKVLEWLGAYGTPVIMLSATLPSTQRRKFVEAYDRGRDALRPAAPSGDISLAERRARQAADAAAAKARYASLDGEIGYPVISVSADGEPARTHHPPHSRSSRTVELDRLPDDLPALIELLKSALREGGNAAVVRNTVTRAQETADALRQAFDDDTVTLAHSRFLGIDRAEKDRELLNRYGRTGKRPTRSIVVATQVIEQSLDIDFDLMVTDVAPIDLLLQRSGRLHRHARNDRPAPLRTPRLVITGVDWSTIPPACDRGSAAVYPEALLLRTLAALDGRVSVTIPDEIAPLVEAVYGDTEQSLPDDWHDAVEKADEHFRRERREQSHRAQSYLLQGLASERRTLMGWVAGPDVDPELTPPGRATVRDSDETLEVVVLQRAPEGHLILPTWLPRDGGRQIPTTEPPDGALTRTILGCMLRLPSGMCRGNALDRHIEALERAFELPAWHASHTLKGELVLVLDGDGRGRLNEFDLDYTPADGLRFSRRTP